MGQIQKRSLRQIHERRRDGIRREGWDGFKREGWDGFRREFRRDVEKKGSKREKRLRQL